MTGGLGPRGPHRAVCPSHPDPELLPGVLASKRPSSACGPGRANSFSKKRKQRNGLSRPQRLASAACRWTPAVGETPLQSLGYLRRVHRVLTHQDAKPPPATSRIGVSRAASATCMFQVRGWSLCSTGQQARQRREHLRTWGCARFLLRPGALNSCHSRASRLAAQGQAPREPIPAACALGSSGLRPVPASRSPPATQSSPRMCC